jgi:hypothetical protein
LVTIHTGGSFSNLESFLKRAKNQDFLRGLERYGSIGVAALASATPVESSKTANSWYYEIIQKQGSFTIQWLNSNVEDPGRIPVAILIQYGHGTGNGGFIQGRDFINPATRPIFDQIAADIRKEVTR